VTLTQARLLITLEGIAGAGPSALGACGQRKKPDTTRAERAKT